MPKSAHTELNCSSDGPWITMHGDTGSVTINLREVMRGELFAANPYRKRILAEWLRARDAEGEVGKIATPDVPPGTRLGPRSSRPDDATQESAQQLVGPL
jgi:hypothetical protein